MAKPAPAFNLVLLLCLIKISVAQTGDINYRDGELFVKLKNEVSDTISLKSPALLPLVPLYNITALNRPLANIGSDTLDRTYKLRFSNIAGTKLLMDTLSKLSIVDYVERVPRYQLSFTPNDPDSNGQYFLKLIQAREAWDITKGSPNVVVAIVDNAMLVTHQDLAANMVPGYDVADNDNDVAPPLNYINNNNSGVEWNHGTHCSGDASAVTNNGKGVAGIGYNTKIMPVKCTSDTSHGGGDIDFPDEGILYAMTHGASIISLSWGGYGTAVSEQVLVNLVISKNIVIVAAAGNSDSAVFYPAAYKGVICVGATDSLDKRAPWSDYGPRIDVMAPGDQIYSTFGLNDSSYREFSGTSMSTPIVAGLCALVLALHPDYTPVQVLSAIKAGCDDISAQNPGFNGLLGAGRINAFRTLSGIETAVNSLGGAVNIKIYPNPFATKLILNMNNTLLPATVELLDIQGKTVMNQTITNDVNPEVETGQLPNGMYIIRIVTGNGIYSSKLIKM